MNDGEITWAENNAPEARRFRCVVGPELAGQRLDRALALQSFLPTRSRIAGLVRSGRVSVDGVQRKASYAVCAGSVIEIEVPPEPPSEVEPEAIDLDVLYEDDALIVVDKPAGMASHPAPGSRRGTLVAALLGRWKLGADWPDPQRPGIVHRLDKDTTGVMVVAKTPQAMHALARQFAARSVEKTYLAVVHGVPHTPTGSIDLPIGRDPIERKRMQARIGQARAAVTHFELLQALGDRERQAAVLRIRPETGRTHQIRVHLASIGFPIVGDSLYGRSVEDRRAEFGRSAPPGSVLGRQALHAATLQLRHPDGGRLLHFVAPLPQDMRALIELLGAQRPVGRGGTADPLSATLTNPTGST